MLRHYVIPALALVSVLVLCLASVACSPRDEGGDRTAAAGDSVAPEDKSASGTRMATKTGEVRDLQAPEAARYDQDQNVWFVANINGTPFGKDNNGFITRLTAEGKVDSLKFIAGGRRGVTLNAPKGMEITGDTLWVADIDAVRAFNRRTGAPVTSVKVTGAKFLNDIAEGPDGALYATDTGVAEDFSHPGPDRIYQIKGGKASVALESEELSGPNGITWVPDEEEFVIVPFMGTNIMAWKPGEKKVRTIGTGPGQQDGVEVIEDGGLLITSWTDSSLFVLRDGRPNRIGTGIPSGADIGFDGESKVLVPLLGENRIEFWELP